MLQTKIPKKKRHLKSTIKPTLALSIADTKIVKVVLKMELATNGIQRVSKKDEETLR